MAHTEKTNTRDIVIQRRVVQAAGALSVLLMLLALKTIVSGQPADLILTPDQQGHRLFSQGSFESAAERFQAAHWRAATLFRAGEFERAHFIWVGMDTAEAAYNDGNALIMLGKYEDAVKRYDRALQLRPEWPEAIRNREIAQGRGERLVRQGDEGVSELGADDIVFSDENNSGGDTVEVEEMSMADGAEARELWLRGVQTDPADFLRAKFAYQHAKAGNQP